MHNITLPFHLHDLVAHSNIVVRQEFAECEYSWNGYHLKRWLYKLQVLTCAYALQEAIMEVAADRQLYNVLPGNKGAQVGMLTADRAAICMDEMNKLFGLPNTGILESSDDDDSDDPGAQ